MTIYTKFMTKLQLNGNIWNIKIVFKFGMDFD